MASAYLTKTFSTPTNNKIFTFSAWVKRSATGSTHDLFSGGSDGSNEFFIRLDNDDTFFMKQDSGGSEEMSRRTNRLFRDTNAWYHIVVAIDTTNATAGDRQKLYINGEQETSFSSSTNFGLNDDVLANTASSHSVGRLNYSTNYFDGSMAHVHFIDGTAYDASTFGETDATTGIWKPKTAPSVTYGTNGFFLKFENSGAFGTDSSGNANNFTVNGTMTQTIDTPSNVFATINPLDNLYISGTLSNGNNKIVTGISQEANYITSTLGVSSGKYYCEIKNLTPSGRGHAIGISGKQCDASNDTLGGDIDGFAYRETGSYKNNGSTTAYGDSYTQNDIIGIALDLDNNKLYFSKNGTWQNSGDPTSGATGTGAISIGTPSTGYYFIALGDESGDTNTFETNFGNGYFGTTAVSSAENPDDGIGIFEYDVPTGYRALCTKSINAEEYN